LFPFSRITAAMNNTLSSAFDAYRRYRAAKAKSKLYRAARYVLLSLTAVYVLLLCYPQVLFAHQISYKNFTVYSRQPLDQNVYAMLDKVEARLATSSINNTNVRPKIFLTNSQQLYSALSLYLGANSFGKGMAVLPTSNIFINDADVAKDLVFRKAPAFNQRSLSEVVAHEVTHILIREKFGYVRNLTMPTWKKEGYAEYVSGGTTLDYASGASMWKANPNNDRGYQYFKYYSVVKYLLDTEKLSVEALFNGDFDRSELEAKVLNSL
jgi:hypothetical protein